MKFTPSAVALLATTLFAFLPQVQSKSCTFLQLVIDESGSMEQEQVFLKDQAMPDVIRDLELNFNQDVFVCSWGFAFTNRRQFPLSGRSLGCSKGFDTNDYDFQTNGGTEDGYAAIRAANDFADQQTSFDGTPLGSCDEGVNKYMILATDEDRDEFDTSKTFASTRDLLRDNGWTLHAILNNPIDGGNGIGAIETSTSSWVVYTENPNPISGQSRYIKTPVSYDPVGRGPGKPDYSPLAFFTDGAVWDLNKLRRGGFTTQAFTDAFIEITTEIIVEAITTDQPTKSPAPTSSAPPTIDPRTANPTATPNICSTTVVLPCVKDTSEGIFRGVLRILLEPVLTEDELTAVIPPLADELNSVAIQLAVQKTLCDFSKNPNPATFDFADASASIFAALLTETNFARLGDVTLKTLRANIEINAIRAGKLGIDLVSAFTGGIKAENVVGNLVVIMIKAFSDALDLCLGINVPVPPPVSPPSEDPEPSPFICFSGLATVDVEGKGTTPMEQLKIGDSVRTANGSYSRVYSFGHREFNKITEYLQIQADIGKHHHSLEISLDHMLYKHNLETKKKKAVPASSIKVGDWIVSDGGSPVKVSSISKIIRAGAHSPLTGSGNLLVNGIVTSNYATRPWIKDWVPGELLHYLQHGAALPFRLYCAVAGCQDETYDEETGFPPLIMFGHRIEQWQLGLHPVLQALFLMAIAVPGSFVMIVGMLLTVPASTTVTHLLVCLAGYFIWKKAHGKHDSGINKEEMKAGSKH